MGESEAQEEENALDLKRDHLPLAANKRNKNRKFLELVERAMYNPKYFEEYERLLRNKDYFKQFRWSF